MADDVEAEALVLHHLDPPAHESLFVVFGPADRAIGVALVDASTGALEASAKLPGTGRALPVDAGAARAIAGADQAADVRLAWRPSRASMSPMLPLWEVRAGDADPVYIDQHGRTWTAAQLTTPGAPG
ncbi:MAG: hypothetical protein E6J91_53315 [Deltaproteobacteria bacterium]|nr:MAG: hypothetical protein E6J91_53315 [Deltaproteobacteria bacterium]